MHLFIVGFLVLMLSHARAEDAVQPQCGANLDAVQLILCIDDDIKEFEDLKNFVMGRIYKRIEIKYAKKDAARASLLKAKVENSAKAWDSYRLSFCDLESIHISDEDSRSQFVKDCLISMTKSRIEELRLLQINI